MKLTKLQCFVFGMLIAFTMAACSMGGRSKRLVSEIDLSKSAWEWCTPEMIKSKNAFYENGSKATSHKGNLCIVECNIKLKKDGSCKKEEYKYLVKEAKKNHDFFMNKYICVPEDTYF